MSGLHRGMQYNADARCCVHQEVKVVLTSMGGSTHLEHSPDQILGEIVKLEQGVCVLGRAGSWEMLSQLHICQGLCSWPLLLPICIVSWQSVHWPFTSMCTQVMIRASLLHHII